MHLDSTFSINWVSKQSPLPLFSLWDFSVGSNKAIGGLVMTGYSQGSAAAKIAKDILSGISPENILPIIPEKGQFIYSKKQLKKWNIKLPTEINLNAKFID